MIDVMHDAMHSLPAPDPTELFSVDDAGVLNRYAIGLKEAMPQIVWTANPDGGLDYYNQHWVDYTGMSVAQTLGWGWGPVLHEDDLANCVAVWTKSVETGAPYWVEYRFRRASDGSYRWHLGRARPLRDESGRIVKWIGTCTDIQDQKDQVAQVELQVQARTDELARANTRLLGEIEERRRNAELLHRDSLRLNEIITTQTLLAGAELNLDAFFQLVVLRLDLLTPSAGSAIEIAEGDEMVYRAGSGVAAPHVGLRLNLHTSLSGLCVKSGSVLRCDDSESDSRVDAAACRRLNVRSMVVAPLFHAGVAIGALKAMAVNSNAFSERDVQTLQLLAGLIGAAIAHQSAFDAKQTLLNELSNAVQNVNRNERRTRTIIESSHDAFIAINAEGRIIDWNRQAEIMFGWSRSEVDNRLLSELIIPERFRSAHEAGMQHFHLTGEGPVLNKRIELPALHRDGKEFPAELTINAIRTDDHYEYCAFLHDITERKAAEERLQHMAQYDQLTGLPNRTLFYDRLGHAMARSLRTKKLLGLMYLDIDHFKLINDSAGHAVGDALLREFAARLKASVRSADTVARLGGDEFVILLEELSGTSDGVVITEKIMDNVRREIALDGGHLQITTSLGGTFFHGEAISAEALVIRADTALYRAKENGRNRAFWMEPVT